MPLLYVRPPIPPELIGVAIVATLLVYVLLVHFGGEDEE